MTEFEGRDWSLRSRGEVLPFRMSRKGLRVVLGSDSHFFVEKGRIVRAFAFDDTRSVVNWCRFHRESVVLYNRS